MRLKNYFVPSMLSPAGEWHLTGVGEKPCSILPAEQGFINFLSASMKNN